MFNNPKFINCNIITIVSEIKIMNFLFKKTLHILYILILGILIKVEPFTPQARVGHSSVLVENKLYFFGGNNLSNNFDEVFYLNTSKTFNITSQPWIDLTASAKIPFGSSWSTVLLINM